jgi:hypothetical protein
MTYLSTDHLMQALARGRKVEQWLGPMEINGDRLLKWVCIEKESRPDYSVVLIEVYNDGGPILERLPPLDVDEPEGKISSFETKEEALAYVTNELGASLNRFVKEGEIQQEYDRYLSMRSS